MNEVNEKNINPGIIHGDENINENKNENDRTGECENKFENINGECNLNLDCPASSLGNRDVHDKVDGTADTLGERNQKDRYKNN